MCIRDRWWSCVGLSGLSPEIVAKAGEDSLVLRISQHCSWSLPLQTWLTVVWGDGLLPARKQVSKQAVLERPTSKKKNYYYSNALFQRVRVSPAAFLLKYSLFLLVPIQAVVNRLPCHKTTITNIIPLKNPSMDKVWITTKTEIITHAEHCTSIK